MLLRMAAKCSRNLSTRSSPGRWPDRFEHAGDSPHDQGVRSHPSRGIRLLQAGAGRDVRTVDRADVVQPEETTLEDVTAVLVRAG